MRLSSLGLALGLVTVLGCSGRPTAGCADLVLRGGPIFTADASLRTVEGLAVAGEWIVESGSAAAASGWICPHTRVIELAGRLATPGMNDAHMHLGPGGLTLLQVPLLGTTSVTEVEERVREAAARAAPGEWILGRGWDHTRMPEAELGEDGWPTRDPLDRAAPDNPVVLRRVDGHAAWVNRAALAAAGIGRDTPDPPGGRFLRHPRTNEPSGILLEEPARLVIMQHAPLPSGRQRRQGIERAMEVARRVGVTSVQTEALEPEIGIYQEMLRRGELTLRIYAWRQLTTDTLEAYRLAGITQGFGGAWLRLGLLKIYADGTLGSRTASLLEPYADDPANRGIVVTPRDSLRRWILAADSARLQVMVHAIGDSAIRVVLDILEEAARAGDDHPRRHRIEHVQVVDSADIPRFATIGVVASMQPTHATTDMRWAEARIGPERATEGAYAWRSLLDAGAHVAFGTDFAVEPLDPVEGLYSAVTRQSREAPGTPAGGWLPEQRLTIREAIRLYTAEPAFAEFEEFRKGTLEAGKLADIVVWDRDLLSVPPGQILEAAPDFTIVGGRIVYAREAIE